MTCLVLDALEGLLDIMKCTQRNIALCQNFYFTFFIEVLDCWDCGGFLFIVRHLVPCLLSYGCDFVSLETFAGW